MITAALRVRAADYDVVVYGGTAAGVTAAMQAKAMGKSVIIVGPDKHLGGLTAGGLGWTDTGNKAVIGGLARSFITACGGTTMGRTRGVGRRN